jgi:hypothetical protein
VLAIRQQGLNIAIKEEEEEKKEEIVTIAAY